MEKLKSCIWCESNIIAKGRPTFNKHSEKNNLGYYTEKEADKDKYFCDRCAFRLYFNEREKILTLISSKTKAQHLRSYISLKKTQFLNKLKNGEDVIWDCETYNKKTREY